MSKNFFTIGEAAKISGISPKTLRYYDQLGLIVPKEICDQTGYRYYDMDTLLSIPIIKYYKQMGFTLNEMKGVSKTESYYFHQQHLFEKIDALKKEKQKIENRYTSAIDWYALIQEGHLALNSKLNEISVKFYQEDPYYCYNEQLFRYNYKESIVNFPWVNYLEKNDLEITGPVILRFPSYTKKWVGTETDTIVMQRCLQPEEKKIPFITFGGKMAISCYHVGTYKSIQNKYEKIECYAKKHNYKIGPECYERYVIDYWSSQNPEQFVTEIIVPISDEK